LHYLRNYDRAVEPVLAFQAETKQQWLKWRSELREELADVIGLGGMDDSGLDPTARRELQVRPGPVEQCKGYRRLAFTIKTADDLFVPAFLLVPDELTEPRPAILCSHGHGIGMNGLVGLTEAGKPRQFGKGYQHDFALQAVRAGFVALAFDQMGFGRRRDIEFDKAQKLWNHCEQPSKNALHFGLSMTGIRIWDALRMIDFLQTRPEVDGEKIGMVGISGGGLVTQFTAALDERIKAACISGYCNRYADCILSVHHCIDNYVPALGLVADNDDIACMIAPRPVLIEGGTEDPIFPIAATRAAIKKVKRCYKVAGASGHVETNLFEGPHEFDGSKTWDFFARHLGVLDSRPADLLSR
jgi:dienelactone hydrolase